MWPAYVNNPWIFVQKSLKAFVHLWQGGLCSVVTCEATFFFSAANMWPLSGIFLPSHCLSFWNRGSEICRPRILYEPSPRERFFGVLQSSFCFSQILCYEADKSQILVRNASLKSPQSAFSIFKHKEYFRHCLKSALEYSYGNAQESSKKGIILTFYWWFYSTKMCMEPLCLKYWQWANYLNCCFFSWKMFLSMW